MCVLVCVLAAGSQPATSSVVVGFVGLHVSAHNAIIAFQVMPSVFEPRTLDVYLAERECRPCGTLMVVYTLCVHRHTITLVYTRNNSRHRRRKNIGAR